MRGKGNCLPGQMWKAEREIFEYVMQWDDQKCNVFKTAKRMVKINQDIIGEQYFYWWKKKRTWKTYHEQLLNTEFAWDRNNLSNADTITSIPCSIAKDTVRESISKIKNEKAAELSGIVSEMVKKAGEAGVEKI